MLDLVPAVDEPDFGARNRDRLVGREGRPRAAERSLHVRVDVGTEGKETAAFREDHVRPPADNRDAVDRLVEVGRPLARGVHHRRRAKLRRSAPRRAKRSLR
jgi:hypothetical protein